MGESMARARFRWWVLVLLAVPGVWAQQGQHKPLVYIASSDSWQVSGFWQETGKASGDHSGLGIVKGGARPQTVELMKTFAETCPAVTVTLEREQAAYVVLFDREGGKGLLRRKNKLAVFGSSGQLLQAASTRSLGGAVRAACQAIQADWLAKRH